MCVQLQLGCMVKDKRDRLGQILTGAPGVGAVNQRKGVAAFFGQFRGMGETVSVVNLWFKGVPTPAVFPLFQVCLKTDAKRFASPGFWGGSAPQGDPAVVGNRQKQAHDRRVVRQKPRRSLVR